MRFLGDWWRIFKLDHLISSLQQEPPEMHSGSLGHTDAIIFKPQNPTGDTLLGVSGFVDYRR